jgi:integrase
MVYNAIPHSYRDINKFLNWKPDEDGYHRATSHMLRKFSQHPADKCRNPRGNPGARVGHKFKDRVRDAYYLADPDDLRKTYMRYEKFPC